MSVLQSAPQAPAAYPVAFDREGRQLFGWYHPPAVREGQTRDCAVVMCNPIGYDAICTYRHYRVLAFQLAEAGFAVLRYDHHGTGDSAGNDEDPKRIAAWINGVSRAVEFAQQRSGASKVSLFGVRFGGTLALAAASAQTLATSVVAWAPFASGALYLREMRVLRMARDTDSDTPPVAHDAGADVGEEAAGYLLTASTIAELGELSLLAGNAPPAAEILLLARDDIPSSEKLARHLIKTGCKVEQLTVPGYAAMMLDTFDAVVPQAALTEIGNWLCERYGLQASKPALPASDVPRLIAGSRGAESDVAETPVLFGPEGQFFGIVSESLIPQGERGGTGVIFVNVGSNHHIGPNRMYVTQARALASLGFVSLRMDIGGVGESPASPGHAENHLYAMHSVADVRCAVQFMRDHKQVTKVVLIGVCSGAYLSFHTALSDPAIASVVLINPQTFTWREGDSLKLRMSSDIRPLGYYKRNILKPEVWLRLMKGKLNVRLIVSGVSAVLWRRIRTQLATSFERDDPANDSTAPLNVRGSFRRLLKRGMNVYLLYSGNDGGLPEMGTQLGRGASSVRKSPHFKLEIVDGADHTFTPLWAQRRLLDLLTQHLMRLYG